MLHRRFPFGPRFALRARRKVLILANEPIPRKPLAEDAGHCGEKSTLIAMLILALVEPENLFVQIPEQVEGFHRNVGALDGSLEQTPKVLQPVRVNAPLNVSLRMVDDLVLVFVSQGRVTAVLVRLKFGTFEHILADAGNELGPIDRGNNLHDHARSFLVLAVALKKPHDGRLAIRSGLAFQIPAFLDVLVHVPGRAANEAFIDFNRAGQLGANHRPHVERQSDSMQHEPRGFLSHSKGPRQFARRRSVLRVHDYPHGRQPFLKAKRRVLKQRADLHGKLFPTFPTFPDAPSLQESRVRLSAMRANHIAIRPAKITHEFQGSIRVGEVGNRILQSLGETS